MLNKKRVLAMAMSSAMVLSALAGCSNNSSSQTPNSSEAANPSSSESAETPAPSSSADETNPEESAGSEEPSVVEPNYTVEDGKAITFEDGKADFIKLNMALLEADECKLEVVDYNGSKALKATPSSKNTGKRFHLGFDLDSLLGDKVADVASIKMQIGVEGQDGEFYACSGSVYQRHDDGGAAGTWASYLAKMNPTNVEIKFSKSYEADAGNVMVITKDADSGSNSDTAYSKTGEYSSMYIDNIVFLDASGNAIDVDTSVAFAGPEGYGEVDWSNLIEVKDQIVIPGFSVDSAGSYAQAPDWIYNICEQPVVQKDEDGNDMKDEDGNPIYEQEVDEDGNPVVDEDGNPVYKTEKVGAFDWASIMKPGTVFTLHYSSEWQDSYNPYIWFVMMDNGGQFGWTRIKSAPDAKDVSDLFRTNDSRTMAQVTFEEIDEALKKASGLDEIDYTSYFGVQAECGMAWSLSAVTYALDQEY